MIISILLFIAAVFFYTLSQKRVFEESDEWQNKYKKPLTPSKHNWYTYAFNIKYKERFPLSATLLVSITDRYHFYQSLFKLLLCSSIITYQKWLGYWDIALYFILFGIAFTVFYRLAEQGKR